MNLRSPGIGVKRPFQSSLACSIRSLRKDTKFRQAFQGSAAEKYEARAARCSYRDPITRTEEQKPRAVEFLTRDVDPPSTI